LPERDQSAVQDALDRLKDGLSDRKFAPRIPWEFAGPPDYKRTHSVAECINEEMHKPDPSPPLWWPPNIGIAEQPYADRKVQRARKLVPPFAWLSVFKLTWLIGLTVIVRF
jgi:hypothetical protein